MQPAGQVAEMKRVKPGGNFDHVTRSCNMRVASLALIWTAATACVTSVSGKAQTAPLAIQPMTKIMTNPVGYFQDPYPVRLAPSLAGTRQVFSGTTKAIMRCDYPISPACFSWIAATISTGTLGPKITAAGAHFTNFQNLNVFQDDAGDWHAVLAIGVASPARPAYWTVLVHAHPSAPTSPKVVPLSWSADTILSGSFTIPVDGNYDGKYIEDDGRLYLLYVKNYVPRPALRNEIVLQPLLSPTRLAFKAPTTLLATGDRFGPLNSEWFDHTPSKLVEAPFIARIGGKYALIYSTGDFQRPDYKAGVAWSDTLMPPAGGHYRKVLQPDPSGIWGRPGKPEVRYLVQSQFVNWPNFTGGQVLSPGVASAEQSPAGAWWLCFAGYDPDDNPQTPPSGSVPSYRRPYVLGLRASVPRDQSVMAASDGQLASWLEPVAR